MALIQTITLQNGLEVQDAYIRIDTVSGSKNRLDISVKSYVSRDSFNSGLGFLEQVTYNFVPSVADGSHNFIKQGYEYLKTLPEYADAVDVIE